MAYTPPSPNDAGLIFSEVYTPPVGSNADLVFGAGAEIFYQVWTDDYVYAATSEGLRIYDITSEGEYAYVTYSGGFNTVWANDAKIFVGTTTDGVKYINKTCVSGSVGSPYELVTCLADLSDLTYYHELTSDDIRYVHGSGDILCVVTNLGVDVVKIDPQSYRSYTTISGAKKCFMTSSGRFYYMTLDTLHVMYTCLYDWAEANKEYTVSSGIFESGIELNDIFITEQTSSDNTSNTVFAATTSGAYVIDESNDGYSVYYNNVLNSDDNNFVAIWADSATTSGSGKMYIGSQGYFNVIDLSDQTLYDWYSESKKGRGNETLDGSDIVDLNVT